MIFLPERFDLNEWTVIAFFLLTLIIALRLPPRFPLSIIVTMAVFSAATARIFDHALAGPVVKDLYDIMDLNKVEWFDLLTYLMFAPPGYLFLYAYEKWQPKGLQIVAFLLVTALLSTGIEWLLHLGHVFTNKSWKIEYSFLVYLFVQPLTLRLFVYLKTYQWQKE